MASSAMADRAALAAGPPAYGPRGFLAGGPGQGRPARCGAGRLVERADGSVQVARAGDGGGAGIGGGLGGQPAERVAQVDQLVAGHVGVGAAERAGTIRRPDVEASRDGAQPGPRAVRIAQRVVYTVPVGPDGVHQLDRERFVQQRRVRAHGSQGTSFLMVEDRSNR